jgi:glutaminyl-peptide cyclotransferase
MDIPMEKTIEQTPPEPKSAVDICKIKTSQYEVLHCWQHDAKAFTEGLEYHDGFLYESTGGDKNTREIGCSSLRKVEIETGEVLHQKEVDDQYFAEGLTIFRDKIFQLTYRTHIGFIYDLKSLKLESEFPYDHEGRGWGLTHDQQHLIMSDGSSSLRILDPTTLKTVSTLPVTDSATSLSGLNELEYVNGIIYANVDGENYVACVDANSGKVLDKIDFSTLSQLYESKGQLNGLAFDPGQNRWFVTGKHWPTLFELRLL